MSKLFKQMKFIILMIIIFPCYSWSQSQIQIVSLSDSIGTEIDEKERELYHLFPDINGFQNAQVVKLSEQKYRIDFSYHDAMGVRQSSRIVSKKAIDLTILHIKLTDEYFSISQTEKQNAEMEAEMLYSLALKYASQRDYEVTSKLLRDLISGYSQTQYSELVKGYYLQTNRLWQTNEALFWKGSLLDQSGRTEILIFSGYYGLWLGVATPIYFEAESSQAYALGLLLGGPLSVMFANAVTKEANISDGRASIISLSGHLGTWQGIGWAAVAEAEGNNVVGLGELCGLIGIGAATILTNKIDFSTGHAELTSSGLQWGAWFGLVLGMVADLEGNDVLRSMLIGSDALIVGTVLFAKDVRMSKARVRLINLAGIIGAVFGFGIDLLLEVDDASTAFAIAGIGSVAGLVTGTSLTKNLDKGKELTFLKMDRFPFICSKNYKQGNWSIYPKLFLKSHPVLMNRLVPMVGLQLDF